VARTDALLRRRCRCRRVRIGVSVRDRVKVGGGCGGMSSSVSSPPSRLISDELWALVEPLILPRPPAVHGRTGRPRTSDRDVLEGIAFVLSTGIGWTKLPRELGYGSGWTCWRRMRQWHEAGVFDRLHQAVLDQLGEHGRLDWSRASLDSVSVRAKRGVH
jgi:transposase